ncbi:hypothetical protein ABZX98_06745 [Streptomyces sp. NPDC002992]|uniref:hypothetical protein n=1 Tax=Streptomyces sp. NPDC002992 TaxID=3154273 RepID=UPI0033AC8107
MSTDKRTFPATAGRLSRIGRSVTASTAAAMVAGGLALLAPAPSAHAAASDCEGGRNGFVDISDNAYDIQAKAVTLWNEGIDISLQYGNVNGVQRGWALIAGDVQPGNSVWLDWSRDGGRTWIQCGPFVSKYGENKTSAAQRTSSDPNWVFRACGSTRSGIHCTSPWW